MPLTLYSIGHSTRSLDEFVALLQAHGITRLADVRTVPRSRRHPHFSADALRVSLPKVGVAYRHLPTLGGLRKPRPDSINTAWRHEGFRGYADYMETPAFEGALNELIEFASESENGCGAPAAGVGVTRERNGASASGSGGGAPRLVMMCAEAVWWRCHRQLIADTLVARGIEVCHITSTAAARPHSLTEFARVADGRIRYPTLI